MGQELATGLRKSSTLYFPQQGLPPPTGPGGAAAAPGAGGGPPGATQSKGTLFTAGAQTPNPLSETMTATTVHSPPGSTVQPVSTAPSSSFSPTSSAVTGMTSTSGAAVGTPISVDSNAQPADVIKKAMDKVAPNMKLQSLKIKTGNETNVLTLPPDFGAPHAAPAAAPSQAASTAPSATTVGAEASHPPPPAPAEAQATASSASHAPPAANTFVTTPYAPPEAHH